MGNTLFWVGRFRYGRSVLKMMKVEDQMNTLGEARKKLYEAYGEAGPEGW